MSLTRDSLVVELVLRGLYFFSTGGASGGEPLRLKKGDELSLNGGLNKKNMFK